jgi:hypothetical protein
MRIARVHLSVVLLAVAAQFAIATAAAQQQAGRRGDIEYYGMATYTSSSGGNVKSIADVHYDLNHLWMWGGGGAYFFTDRLSVLLDLAFGSSNLRLSDTRAPNGPSFTQGADFFNGRLNLEFTPFATAISRGDRGHRFQQCRDGRPRRIAAGVLCSRCVLLVVRNRSANLQRDRVLVQCWNRGTS